MQAAFPFLSRTPGAVRHAGPAMGAHNAEIYEGVLGLSPAEIADLRARKVI
ncbi:hypothetical protein D3C83_279000 [compost metagenome]